MRCEGRRIAGVEEDGKCSGLSGRLSHKKELAKERPGKALKAAFLVCELKNIR